jgi:hypothetical protein
MRALLYKIFSSKIEIPLKRDILTNICPLIDSTLEYSYTAKYAFDELGILEKEGLIKTFDFITLEEDSLHFSLQKGNQNYTVNGFELQTSKMRGIY